MFFERFLKHFFDILITDQKTVFKGVFKMSILKTENLKKYYGKEPNVVRALDGVSLEIEDGEFVAVVGTSGSGKSTLLNMMGGLDVPSSGKVIIADKDLSGMDVPV